MILVTIGTQLPFDRLISAIDALAPQLEEPVYAQIGDGAYQPRNIEFVRTVPPAEFETRFRAARLIVAHAGIGTVLMAQKLNKPIVMFPREARFGEHRNDHQLATCRELAGRQGIYLARDSETLLALLKQPDLASASVAQSLEHRERLVSGLRGFIQGQRS